MVAKDLNIDSFLDRQKGLFVFGRTHDWHYGDSHGWPPCSDGLFSCDRIPMRAMWDLGFTDQPIDKNNSCGVVVSAFDEWLTSHGWLKYTSYDYAKRGSICVVRNSEGGLHAFTIESYDRENKLMARYDGGSDDNMYKYEQPIVTGLNLYPDLVALYNVPSLNKTAQRTGKVVNCSALFVRTWAGKDYPTLTTQPHLVRGEYVNILDMIHAKDGNEWYYILTTKGKHGFVRASYIE